MSAWVEIVTGVMVIAGGLFCLVGGIGLLRLPDFFSRTHASSISDTLGAGLVLLGLAGRALAEWATGDASLDVMLKLLLLLAFIFVVSPTATHALAKAAYSGGVRFSPEDSEGPRESSS